jgi:hypothetical protein
MYIGVPVNDKTSVSFCKELVLWYYSTNRTGTIRGLSFQQQAIRRRGPFHESYQDDW